MVTNESTVPRHTIAFNRFEKAKQRDYEMKKWRKINDNKLIIYLHFHKAGGSSLIKSALEVTAHYHANVNGNPMLFTKQRINGKNWTWLPFWEYNEISMEYFIKHIFNVSFIAMENQYFYHADSINSVYFKKRFNVKIITQIRDPYKTFISNFFYHIKYKTYKENVPSIQKPNILQRLLSFYHGDGEYLESTNCWSSWNLYIRVLTLNCNDDIKDDEINATNLMMAKNELDKFDTITILDKPETFKLLEIEYGIVMHTVRNDNSDYLKPYLLNKEEKESLKQFEHMFMERNKFDYMLYEYAIKLSFDMLNQ